MPKHNGHTCTYCGTYTFHNHCHSCGLTRDEAESALLKQLNEQEPENDGTDRNH